MASVLRGALSWTSMEMKSSKFDKGKGGWQEPGKGGDGAKDDGKGLGLCWEWQQSKTCRFGSKCKFSHGEAEKRKAPEEEGREAKKPRSR